MTLSSASIAMSGVVQRNLPGSPARRCVSGPPRKLIRSAIRIGSTIVDKPIEATVAPAAPSAIGDKGANKCSKNLINLRGRRSCATRSKLLAI
jgi:hypothetical protein